MGNEIERRIEALEEKAKPPVISTLLDLVVWVDEHENDEEEVELSPELQELAELASENNEGPGGS
jgi:hypothetical protein